MLLSHLESVRYPALESRLKETEISSKVRDHLNCKTMALGILHRLGKIFALPKEVEGLSHMRLATLSSPDMFSLSLSLRFRTIG